MARKTSKAAKAKASNSPAAGTVLVYCGINQGMKFKTPKGEVVLHGVNTAKLVHANGGLDLPAGKFGVNTVAEADWDFISKSYGEMAAFKNGLIYSAVDRASGNDEALDKQEIPTGTDQIDVTADETLATEPVKQEDE